MEILELAHSPSKPVPHPPLRVVGFSFCRAGLRTLGRRQ